MIKIASSYVDNDAMEKDATEGAYFHIRMQWPSFSPALKAPMKAMSCIFN